MASGPSKQELEMYWKSSRQYFDELAKHYQVSDPKYYNEFILPFYTNPFHSSPEGRKSGGVAAKLIVVIIFFAVLGVGAAAFFIFMSSSGTDKQDVKEKRINPTDKRSTEERIDDEAGSEKDMTNEKDSDGFTPEDHFIIGSKAITEKDYDKAEKHLKKIKRGQKYYEQAQQLLENMDMMRKFNK